MADELISRKALLEDIEETVIFTVREDVQSAEMRGANKVIDRIKAAPAVDAVEVVRCKDCTKCESIKSCNGYLDYDCWFHDMEVHSDDYCSEGERREE